MREIERACIECPDRTPVTPTRSPTWPATFSRLPASSTATDALPFFRKPDFQLRDFGACVPSVSVSRNDWPSRCRQPVIVTGFDAGDAWLTAGVPDVPAGCGSIAGGFGAVTGRTGAAGAGMTAAAV